MSEEIGCCEHGYRHTDGTVADWCPACRTMTGPGADDLVERVAKAIFSTKLMEPYWSQVSDNARELYRDLARAAIAAIHVPDRERVEALLDEFRGACIVLGEAERMADVRGLVSWVSELRSALLAAIFGEDDHAS